ncbi:MAG: DegV family protein [Clostridia bacterium]|nr:DegV family protein [Clostridia bacterium]
MAVRLMIDSASDITKKEADKLGVYFIPMVITIGDKEYFDGVDITANEFYEKLVENAELPKTSQISPYRFEEAFEEITRGGDELVVILLSSKLSGTYDGAKQAAEKFKDKVFVVDSMSAAIGERLLLDHALRLVKDGLSAKAIAEKLDEVKEKIRIMAVIDTLTYLKKGGRISATTAFAGKLLSVKPVIAVVDGKVKMAGKAMGSRNANNLLNKLVAESGGIDFSMPFGTIWSGLDSALHDKYVRDSAHLWQNEVDEVPKYPIGATIGTHVGPGAVGVAFFAKK